MIIDMPLLRKIGLVAYVRQTEKSALIEAMTTAKNITMATELLQLKSRKSFDYKIKRYGLLHVAERFKRTKKEKK